MTTKRKIIDSRITINVLFVGGGDRVCHSRVCVATDDFLEAMHDAERQIAFWGAPTDPEQAGIGPAPGRWVVVGEDEPSKALHDKIDVAVQSMRPEELVMLCDLLTPEYVKNGRGLCWQHKDEEPPDRRGGPWCPSTRR